MQNAPGPRGPGASRPSLTPPWLDPDPHCLGSGLRDLEPFLPEACRPLREQLHLDDASLPDHLLRLGLLPAGEPVVVEKAGDGNINWVRRARTPTRSWVVKQARPALERFPEYRVSTHRIVVEARYYQTVAAFDAEGVCPRVLAFDPEARVLVLEDLGAAERLDHALARAADALPAARRVAAFLGVVHARSRGLALAERFRNEEMQRLHGEHIFQLPYRENDFPLSPARRARAEAIRRDRALLAQIDAAYARYLEPRGVLVHGDAQAGNVLLAPRGAVLLDAEIAHVGDPAFDVGVLAAHLLGPGLARGARDGALLEAAWQAYADAAGDAAPPFRDVARIAGIELLRRAIGAAGAAWSESDIAAERVIEAGVSLTASPPDRLDAL